MNVYFFVTNQITTTGPGKRSHDENASFEKNLPTKILPLDVVICIFFQLKLINLTPTISVSKIWHEATIKVVKLKYCSLIDNFKLFLSEGFKAYYKSELSTEVEENFNEIQLKIKLGENVCAGLDANHISSCTDFSEIHKKLHIMRNEILSKFKVSHLYKKPKCYQHSLEILDFLDDRFNKIKTAKIFTNIFKCLKTYKLALNIVANKLDNKTDLIYYLERYSKELTDMGYISNAIRLVNKCEHYQIRIDCFRLLIPETIESIRNIEMFNILSYNINKNIVFNNIDKYETLGDEYTQVAKYDKALKSYQTTLNLIQEGAHKNFCPGNLAEIHIKLGKVYSLLKCYEPGLKSYKEALKILVNTPDTTYTHEELFPLYKKIVKNYQCLGMHDAAKNFYEEVGYRP